MGRDHETRAGQADDTRVSLPSGTWDRRESDQNGSPSAASHRADDPHARFEATENVAIIAVHEIGNVVGWLDMSLALLEREVEGRDEQQDVSPNELHTRIRAARMGVRHIADIVHAMQDLGRPCEAASELFDPMVALRAAIRFAAPRISGRATLVEELGAMPMLRGRKHELTCVLLNLLLNALDALPQQSSSANTITVVATTADGAACFEVRDSGVGISPDVAEHIFHPYRTGKPENRGTGLGLYACRRMVRAMGGELGFESSQGLGTRFRVVLPAAEDRHC